MSKLKLKEKNVLKNSIFSLMKKKSKLEFHIKYNLLGFGYILRLEKKEDKLYFFTTQGITICYNFSQIPIEFLELVRDKLQSGVQDTIRFKEIKEKKPSHKKLNKRKLELTPISIPLNRICTKRSCKNITFSVLRNGKSLCKEHFLETINKKLIKQYKKIIKIEAKNEYLGKIYRHRNSKKYLTIESFYAIFENKNLNGLVLYLKGLGYVYNANPNRIINE